MTSNIHNDYENITNKWKQIFVDFIVSIIDDNGKSYTTYRITRGQLDVTRDHPTLLSKIFLLKFSQNMRCYGSIPNENKRYSEVFIKIVCNYFNLFANAEIETIKQYLKYLCVQAGLGENKYGDIDEDTTIMNNDEKLEFVKSLFIVTSEHFVELHKEFIEDTFINIMTPSLTLK